jgi:hypothetical protein
VAEGKSRYRCPKCGKGTNLYEDIYIPGWRSVNDHLEQMFGRDHWDCDLMQADSEGTYGCGDCNWKGTKQSLTKVGLDGKPLPIIHPNQMAIE